MSVKESIKEKSELLKGQLVFGDHGVAKPTEDWLAKRLEGTDVTADMISKVQDIRDDIIAETGLALGEVGISEFQKDADLAQVSTEMKFGKDSIGGVFHRSRKIPDGDGGMKEKAGVLSMTYKANGQLGSKGQLKKVKQSLAEQAMEVLK